MTVFLQLLLNEFTCHFVWCIKIYNSYICLRLRICPYIISHCLADGLEFSFDFSIATLTGFLFILAWYTFVQLFTCKPCHFVLGRSLFVVVVKQSWTFKIQYYSFVFSWGHVALSISIVITETCCLIAFTLLSGCPLLLCFGFLNPRGNWTVPLLTWKLHSFQFQQWLSVASDAFSPSTPVSNPWFIHQDTHLPSSCTACSSLYLLDPSSKLRIFGLMNSMFLFLTLELRAFLLFLLLKIL